jgi:hypothetical protein
MIYAIYGDEGPKGTKDKDFSRAWMRLIKVNTVEEARGIVRNIVQGGVSSRKNPKVVAIFSDNPEDSQYGCDPVIDWTKPKKKEGKIGGK